MRAPGEAHNVGAIVAAICCDRRLPSRHVTPIMSGLNVGLNAAYGGRMQVLGGLVKITDEMSLPLPWWHRAPLGLQSGTNCYVAIVDNQARGVPDLIVSVLNPSNFDRMLWLRFRSAEGPGVVKQIISHLTDVNIALAESATLEGGLEHQVTLVCEPPGLGSRLPTGEEIKKRFADANLPTPEVRPFEKLGVRKQLPATVNAGWIDGVAWSKLVAKEVTASDLKAFDLTRAVLSADTSTRILRYVFPRRGSRSVRIEHLDEPRVLSQITDLINERGVNMLTMLLTRGGAASKNAILVAVCEPPPEQESDGVFLDLEQALDSLPPGLQAKVRITDVMSPDTTVMPRERGTLLVRMPSEIKADVRKIRKGSTRSRPVIFLSRRLANDGNAEVNLAELRAAVEDAEALLIEVVPGANTVFQELTRKLWAADAGIIFLPKLGKTELLGHNIPHEYGFLIGQGKKATILLERGEEQSFSQWSNVSGVFVEFFAAGHDAANRKLSDSVYQVTQRLVRDVVRSNMRESEHETV